MSKIGEKPSAPTGQDKELLELAANAAQLHLRYSTSTGFSEYGDIKPWNPLSYDGDALHLAVKLRMEVRIGRQNHVALVSWGDGVKSVEELFGEDAYAATRRAIVRAAAEIGKSMG